MLQERLKNRVIVRKMKSVDVESVNARKDTNEVNMGSVLEVRCLVEHMTVNQCNELLESNKSRTDDLPHNYTLIDTH